MSAKLIFAFLLLSATFCAISDPQDAHIFKHFEDFVKKDDKHYNSIEEYMARYQVFRNNYYKLENVYLEGVETYTVALNKFADLTPQEFSRTYLNLNITPVNSIKNQATMFTVSQTTAPDSFSWRDQGAVNEAKDQGSCGSCWAFSTVGNLEGLYKIKYGVLKNFSEQQLVDCDKEKDQGCNGGWMGDAYDYIKKVGGLEETKDYPYTAKGGSCKFDAKKAAFKITGYETVGENENEIKEFLFTRGPLAVAINASHLQFYNGGILDKTTRQCDPQALSHGVTIVGYGTENGVDFWIVRNSWGSGWGENGYFRITRGKGTCGINTYVVSATLE